MTDPLDEPFSLEKAEAVVSWIEGHRSECPRYASGEDCEDCKWWRCACGAPATNTPTYGGVYERKAMCDVCLAQWRRDLDMRYALQSIPADCMRKNVCLASPDLTTWCPDYPKWAAMVSHIVDDASGGAVFYGPKSGVGKTTLAICAMREIVDRGRRLEAPYRDVARAKYAFFTTADKIVQERSKQRLGTGVEAPLVDRAMRASVLVIDELGAEIEKKTGAISEVIDSRSKEGKCTWVTTFLTQELINDYYGSGTLRRLTQDKRIVHLVTPGRKT